MQQNHSDLKPGDYVLVTKLDSNVSKMLDGQICRIKAKFLDHGVLKDSAYYLEEEANLCSPPTYTGVWGRELTKIDINTFSAVEKAILNVD